MKQQNNANADGMMIRNGKLIYSEIIINATPSRIWHILTRFADYPVWNPFIKSISGKVATGHRLKATICPPEGKEMTMHPKVVRAIENSELRWLGSLGLPFIFDGEHSFVLHDNGNGTTTFRHFENFRGVLIPFFKRMLDVNTLNGFKLMNARLKELAEAS